MSDHLYVVENETGCHLDEVLATSFEQAGEIYRQLHEIKGYARLRITDADVFFGTYQSEPAIRIIHSS